MILFLFFIFFFNDTATTEIYTLSLHDALPISAQPRGLTQPIGVPPRPPRQRGGRPGRGRPDRKSTRLNSSHVAISYAVFCLKKKKKKKTEKKKKKKKKAKKKNKKKKKKT